jgi:hypothetical protein
MRGKGQPKEDYGFYDITAWSLPLSYGVEAYWTEENGSFSGTPVTDEFIKNAKSGGVNARAQIAYVVPYETDSAGAMMLRLVQNGFKAAVATRTLNAGGRNWVPGTFVLRVSRNPDTLHDALSKYAREMGVNVTAVNSGFSDMGDTSVGGESVLSLKEAKIAIAADEGVDPESYGAIWWTFDRNNLRFTPMTINSIKSGGLKNYNVLILPDGSAGRYFGSFGTGGVAALKDFASNGGTIVAIRGAAVFSALKDVGLTTSKLVGSDDDEEKGKVPEERKGTEPTASPTPKPGRTPQPEPEPNPGIEMKTDRADNIPPTLPPIASPSANANKVPEALPGSIMRATVDRTTYITYGVNQDEVPVLLASGYFFRYSKEGTNALVFDAEPKLPLTVSGFVWEGNTERLLKGTSYIVDESMGGGHVILFAEDPFFRGMTRTITRPFYNSILFNGVF